MSNLSIFDNRWTELVFEGKNQEYGAFQLRKENSRTSIIAFFSGISLMGVLFGSFMVFSSFTTPNPIPEPDNIHKTIVCNFEPRKEKKPEIKVKEEKSTVKDKIEKVLKDPVIVDNTQKPDDLKKPSDPITSTNPNPGDGKPTGNPTLNPIPTNGGNGGGTDLVGSKKPDGPVNVGVLDKIPTFPGGIDKFREFVGNNFQKPDFDEEKTVTVYVSFVIELDGSLSNIKVLKDPGYGLGKEAIRVLNSLKTKWTAGILDGEKVRTTYTLPIAIQMQ
jgi:periplasmic protein TonB